jgi:hypothetical protein
MTFFVCWRRMERLGTVPVAGEDRSVRRWTTAWQKTMVFSLLLVTVAGFAQEQKLSYTVQHNGKQVGSLNFRRVKAGTRTTYNIQSEVNVKMLLAISVKAQEQSVYENEVLQSSSVLRHVNGRQKANKQIRNNGRGLTVSEDGQNHELKNYLVKYNSHCLYSTEPVHFTNVFADNYQRFVPIVKVTDHQYRVTFPDGNSNDYFYENGICRRIKVKSRFFDAEFVLTP